MPRKRASELPIDRAGQAYKERAGKRGRTEGRERGGEGTGKSGERTRLSDAGKAVCGARSRSRRGGRSKGASARERPKRRRGNFQCCLGAGARRRRRRVLLGFALLRVGRVASVANHILQVKYCSGDTNLFIYLAKVRQPDSFLHTDLGLTFRVKPFDCLEQLYNVRTFISLFKQLVHLNHSTLKTPFRDRAQQDPDCLLTHFRLY